MCQRITCPECGKPSFAGCGRHVESVLGDVPPAQRCPGHAPPPAPPRSPTGSTTGLGKLFDFLSGGRKRSGS
jgi:hypothetical protein